MSPFFAGAAEFRVGEQLSIAASERVNGDFYVAGGNVTTAARIGGDLLVAGGNVLVNGPSAGDLLVVGGSVTILGDVADDARIAGGNITLSGRIGGDLVVGGGQVHVAAPVGGDILAGTGVLRIEAPVTGDVTVGGGEVFINAPVGGNVRFAGETLVLGAAATIAGNLSYTSPKEAQLAEGAVVRGETEFEQARDVRGIAEKGLLAFITLAAVGKFVSILASALIIGLTFSKYSVTLVESAAARPFFELGRGFVTLIMLPVFSVVLILTVIGIPLGLLGLAAFVAAVIFASITAPIILGSVVYRYFAKRSYVEVSWKTILLGVALYTVLGLLPFLGALAKLALMLIAIGVMVKIKIDVARNWL
jgi:hypothetical protein